VLELGVAAVPKATGVDHIRDNWEARTLELTDDELATIREIDRRERVFDPEYAPDW
jgi:Aldo/keto reductases, related to diketogulonate reductase